MWDECVVIVSWSCLFIDILGYVGGDVRACLCKAETDAVRVPPKMSQLDRGKQSPYFQPKSSHAGRQKDRKSGARVTKVKTKTPQSSPKGGPKVTESQPNADAKVMCYCKFCMRHVRCDCEWAVYRVVRSVKGGFDKVMIEKVGVKALERRQEKKQKERDRATEQYK